MLLVAGAGAFVAVRAIRGTGITASILPGGAASHVRPFSAAANQPPASIGDTVQTATGGTVAVLQYVDHFDSDNALDTPTPGGYFAAIEAQVCAPAHGAADANPFYFTLREPNRKEIAEAFMFGGQEPQLHYASLHSGQCVTGWVNFTVKAKPTRVLLRDSAIAWAVP